MDYTDALAYLDAHVNLEALTGARKDAPSLDRMARLVAVMGDPQHAYPVIHITGTNGKGSTSTLITRLLDVHGLSVGLFTSPHLERVNERISRNGEPIGDEEFAEMVGAIAGLEVVAGVRPSYFEILTAAAFRWFADVAVDVAVVEVGMLGRWDATNVADGRVAVITNIGFDHTEYAGPTLADIAREKAGIVKPDSTLVLGETDPHLAAIIKAEPHAAVLERELDFACEHNELAIGGRLLHLRTPQASYPEVFLSLHGRHQGDNAAVALAAVEAFFEAPVHPDLVAEAFGSVRVPGRFEVVGHQPLVILDGAHNPAGAERFAQVMDEDFSPAGDRIMVVGLLRGADRDPLTMLRTLGAEDCRLVVCCAPDSPRAVPVAEMMAAAAALGVEALAVPSVEAALDRALAAAGEDDAVVVTGSLYVVGAARPLLRRRLGAR